MPFLRAPLASLEIKHAVSRIIGQSKCNNTIRKLRPTAFQVRAISSRTTTTTRLTSSPPLGSRTLRQGNYYPTPTARSFCVTMVGFLAVLPPFHPSQVGQVVVRSNARAGRVEIPLRTDPLLGIIISWLIGLDHPAGVARMRRKRRSELTGVRYRPLKTIRSPTG